MRILALSDLHAEEDVLDRLKVRAASKGYDAVFFVGDITTRGPASYAEEVISLFPNSFAVPGNMDTPDVSEALRRKGVMMHGKKAAFGDWNIVGFGGSNPTPYRTPNEFSEEQIEMVLNSAGVDHFSIVLCHPPPFGFFDMVAGKHAGSSAVRKIVEQKKPLMLICGHIHEHEGQQILGETLIVKLGAAQNLRAAEIEIGDKIEVDFISL
ncbi:MAG: metallophosphoesterase family protein [Candidatus Anstonellaceae archaeon]